MAGSFDGFSALEASDPAQIGPYRPLARLGAGGMGRVYLSCLPGGRPVALKTVHEAFAGDPEFRRRFALEARAAQQVNGIHIAQLLDVGVDAPVPWLATAYVPGPSLLEAVRLHGPLPLGVVRSLTIGVARALGAVHQAGLIHRDLKPANVILAEDGPRVIDFGIARAADSTTAGLTRGRVGSPQYMAPEQVRGLAATPALDVFALGALVFFAATGRPAFGEGEDLAVIFRIVQEEPDLSGCPPGVRDLVAGCLQKDPAQRPDVAAIIRSCGADTPSRMGPAIGPGWLPDAVAQMARARAESSAALVAQPPPAPVPPGGASPVIPVPMPTPTLPYAGPPLSMPATIPQDMGIAPPPAQRTSWITARVAGLAAGVAVLSAAIAAGAVLLAKSSSTGGSPSGNGASGSTASGQALGANGGTGQRTSGSGSGGASQTATAGSTVPASDVASGSDAIAWQGTTIVGVNGLNFWSAGVASPGRDLMFELPTELFGGYAFLSEVGYPTGTSVAHWTGSAPPTRQDCLSAIGASGTAQVYIPIGGELCAEGADKQIAAVKVVSVDSAATQATVKVVLWSQPAS